MRSSLAGGDVDTVPYRSRIFFSRELPPQDKKKQGSSNDDLTPESVV